MIGDRFFIFLFIAGWCCLGGIVECNIGDHLVGNDTICPKSLYENTKMNKFGCWFVFILISIISPGFFVIKIIGEIGFYTVEFIKFIFTVGRKD